MQMVFSKRGRGWLENVSTERGCLMFFPGQHWVFLDTSKPALTRSQWWLPPPAERVGVDAGEGWAAPGGLWPGDFLGYPNMRAV